MEFPKLDVSDSEWRFRPECLKALEYWKGPIDKLKDALLEQAEKISILRRESYLAAFDSSAKHVDVDDLDDEIREFISFLIDLDASLRAFKDKPDPRTRGTPTKFSFISREQLEGSFELYWRHQNWACQYFDLLFLVSFLGVEAEAYLLEIMPKSTVGLLFVSKRKQKGELLKKLYELVEIAESHPCSLKFLQSKILEATSSGCFVHSAVVSIVDRALQDSRPFL